MTRWRLPSSQPAWWAQTRQRAYVKDLDFSFHPFLPILGTGLVTADGELWQRQRLLIGTALRIEILDDVVLSPGYVVHCLLWSWPAANGLRCACLQYSTVRFCAGGRLAIHDLSVCMRQWLFAWVPSMSTGNALNCLQATCICQSMPHSALQMLWCRWGIAHAGGWAAGAAERQGAPCACSASMEET